MPMDWIISQREQDMTPDQLDEVAAKLAAKASKLRAADRLEPKGDGSTIRWAEDVLGRSLTYIAVKKGGRWWSTKRGEGSYGRSWIEMVTLAPQLLDGQFDVAVSWAPRDSCTN